MAHKGTNQDQMYLIDEHGNRVHKIDEPNAIQGIAMGFAPAGTGSDTMKKDHHEGQQLRRSCSSSSSSSEDDGEGGRRRKKKGIKEKIKETLTRGADEGVQTTIPIPISIPTPTSSGEAEKKGIMEKIKEKIPGMH